MPTMVSLATLAQRVQCGWAAPELDEQTRSKQSDIFSFACTIYEVLVYFLIFHRCLRICTLKMFTRRPPYEEDSSSEDRSKPPMRTGLLKPKVWNDLWDILVVCWSPDPLYRPTASELEANLRKILQPNSK